MFPTTHPPPINRPKKRSKASAKLISMAAAGSGEEKPQLRLLGLWASPYVWRAQLALHLKGLAYDYVEESLQNKSDLLLQSNPVHKKVPVLLDAGRPVCESAVILEYLDEAYAGAGPAILPADPYDRAIHRFWVAYLEQTAAPAWRDSTNAKTDEEKAEALKKILSQFALMDASFKELCKGKEFLGGDSIGYLDIVFGSYVPWLAVREKLFGVKMIDETTVPFLAAWKERFLSTAAAKEVFPDLERLCEYAVAMRARLESAAEAEGDAK